MYRKFKSRDHFQRFLEMIGGNAYDRLAFWAIPTKHITYRAMRTADGRYVFWDASKEVPDLIGYADTLEDIEAK